MGMKFSMEKSISCLQSTRPRQIHPIDAGVETWGSKTEIFVTQYRNIDAPQGSIPWAIYTKFSELVGGFTYCQILQFGRIR